MSRQEGAGWQIEYDDEIRTAEVLPIDDLIVHMDAEDCICKPRVEQTAGPDGLTGRLIVHSSLDGREVPRTITICLHCLARRLAPGLALAGVALLVRWLAEPWRVRR